MIRHCLYCIVIVSFYTYFIPSYLWSNSYILYPRLESGNNIGEVYGSSFFIPKYEIFTFSSFVTSDFKNRLEYGILSTLSYEPYGTISIGFSEKNSHNKAYKESSINLSYQKRWNIANFIIGANFSDPIHSKAFEFNNPLLYSMNIAIQIEATPDILIEIGATNLFKKYDSIVNDNSEEFYTSVSLMLIESLAVKISIHKFKNNRVNANFLTRYYITNNIFVGLNLSIEPLVFSVSSGLSASFGSFKIFLGMNENKNFFGLLSFTVPYNHDPKPIKSHNNKGIINDKNLININAANNKLLTVLPGIGQKTAKRIITYRKENKGFYSKEELMMVTGIGIKKYEKLKDLITIGNINKTKRLSSIKRWTMKEFIDIGFSPSLSLKIVLLIRNKSAFTRLEDLLKIKNFNNTKLIHLKKRLTQYDNNKN